MSISHSQLLAAIQTRNGYPFNTSQQAAILHGNGPLCIVAGPGTGKTEVLIVRCLKLICCDQIRPRSVLITTFTEKAARNLEDRLNDAFLHLATLHPALVTADKIDPSELRIGTLHGLCNDILQEFRFPAYQNLRLLDDAESALFIYRKVANQLTDPQKQRLFAQFRYLFGNFQLHQLSKWAWTDALQLLFDRAIEDRVQLPTLQAAGGAWSELQAIISLYEQELANAYACDFSRLQRFFLDFLNSPQGAVFLNGDPQRPMEKPPLTHVLVDEYQDTNPIQEDIYFALSRCSPHNTTVVGDDDQALYRFRGGTVECMVGFGSACQTRLGVAPQVVYLTDNYRSDAGIVSFCNTFIQSFPVMAAPNVRMQGKPPLAAASGRAGNYPAVGLIRETKIERCAQSLATLVAGLHSNGIITDYSQCVLLLRSTRTTPRYAGPYAQAITNAGIPVYNPRSRSFLDQDEVAEFLGAFVSIVDPGLAMANALMSPSIRQMVTDWVARYIAISQQNTTLAQYVLSAAQKVCQAAVGTELAHAFPTILYRILSLPPFPSYQQAPDRDLRLSKLTRLFEAFSTQYGRPLFSDNQIAGVVSQYWLSGFYYGLCGYLEREGLDDDEDEDVVCPSGFFPIMTIHQSKGLEFDFVFVGNMGTAVTLGNSHQLEADLLPFRSTQPAVVHNAADSAWHDEVRLRFVAYSRARYALVLIATNQQLGKLGTETASFGGNGGAWIRQNVPRL